MGVVGLDNTHFMLIFMVKATPYPHLDLAANRR
jgi:hypothetical protein